MSVDKTIPVSDASQPTAAQSSRRWFALATVALGVSLIIMDATVVNVALPVVIRDLNLTSTQAEWMNSIYSLVFAALLLTLGRIGDLFGRRKLFAAGIVLFMAASVAAGFADSGTLLIAARLVQGVGAAMILPSTLSTLNAMFFGRERAIAFAVWGATIGGMAAVGPLVGGWLTTDVSWRWAFWLNIPFGILVLFGILFAVPETRDETARKGLDVGGFFLSSVGMAAIVFALIEGQNYGWIVQSNGTISPVIIALVIGIVFMTEFVRVQIVRARKGKLVLIDLRLLGIKSFRFGSIAALIVALGEFGLIFTLPLLLENALGLSPLGTGWLIMSLAIGTFFISGMTPRLTAKFGSRTVVRAGLATEAIAVGGLALTLSMTVSGWIIAVWLFLYGIGVGMATAQLTSVILSDVPVAESGQASGLQSTFRQLGSALGVAVLGSLLIGSLGHVTANNLSSTHLPAAAQEQVTAAVKESAGAAIPALQAKPATASAGDAAASAMVTASKFTTGAAAIIIGIGLIATLALPATPKDHGGQGTENDADSATSKSRATRRTKPTTKA